MVLVVSVLSSVRFGFVVEFCKFVDLQNLRSDVTDIANVGHDILSYLNLMTPPSSTTTTDENEIDTYFPHVRGVVNY